MKHKILRIILYVAIIIAIILWGITIIGWFTSSPGYEPLNVLLGAIISSLISVVGWISTRTHQEKTENNGSDTPEKNQTSTPLISAKNIQSDVIIAGNDVNIRIDHDSSTAPALSLLTVEQIGLSDLPLINPKVLDKDLGTIFIEKELPNKIKKSSKQERENLSIAMLDIDELGIINEHFGDKVGDLVLSVVANLIKRRKYVGSFGRCGDDTFYILIHTDPRKVPIECEKILQNIKHFKWNTISPELYVTATIGYATLNPNEPPQGWIIRSLEGLLEGKRSGKNIANIGPEIPGKKYPRKIGMRRRQIEELEMKNFSLRHFVS